MERLVGRAARLLALPDQQLYDRCVIQNQRRDVGQEQHDAPYAKRRPPQEGVPPGEKIDEKRSPEHHVRQAEMVPCTVEPQQKLHGYDICRRGGQNPASRDVAQKKHAGEIDREHPCKPCLHGRGLSREYVKGRHGFHYARRLSNRLLRDTPSASAICVTVSPSGSRHNCLNTWPGWGGLCINITKYLSDGLRNQRLWHALQ